MDFFGFGAAAEGIFMPGMSVGCATEGVETNAAAAMPAVTDN